ncbi:hypothetical protein EK21DRAFT_53931, partial [Setomelanomma holmii]
VEIGADRTKYHVHKALISRHSEYFEKALKGSWNEAQEGVVWLEDVDDCIFNLFLHWLYSQRIPIAEKDWRHILELDEMSDWKQDRFVALVKAYEFGDRFLSLSFRCQVNNAFAQAVNDCYFDAPTHYECLSYAFDRIPSNRPILQLLIDDLCTTWSELYDEDDTKLQAFRKLPPQVLSRSFLRLQEMRMRDLARTQRRIGATTSTMQI